MIAFVFAIVGHLLSLFRPFHHAPSTSAPTHLYTLACSQGKSYVYSSLDVAASCQWKQLSSFQLIDGLSDQITESIIPVLAQVLPNSRVQASLNESAAIAVATHATPAELAVIHEAYKKEIQRQALIAICFIISVAFCIVYYLYRKTIKLNKALQAESAKLAAANKTKDRIFSIIGHDLRSPVINTINSLMIMAEHSDFMTKEEEKTMYDTLLQQTSASLDTLDKLLFWGGRQIKGILYKPEDLQVHTSIMQALDLYQDLLKQKKVTVNVEVPTEHTIYADQAYTAFVMRNLISNAIKFSHPGGVITVGVSEPSKPNYCLLYIKDEGIGMSAEVLSHLFTVKIQSQKGTYNEKGTGLGLLLCKEFVEKGGGEIYATSTLGQGTTCFFSFPNNQF